MKLELKTFLFSYVLFSSQLNIANCNGLVLCSETVSALQLCKREKSYKPNAIPKPTPRPIDIIIDLKDIIDIDHERNLLTVYTYIIVQWTDPEISYAVPEGHE